METTAKTGHLYFQDKLAFIEVSCQTSLSRNKLSSWLRGLEMIEPEYTTCVIVTKLDAYADTLRLWRKAGSGSGKRERRTKG